MRWEDEVLTYWFGDPAAAGWPFVKAELWFGHAEATDEEIRERFRARYDALMAEPLDALLQGSPRERLARILVFDQFTRNMFRGSGAMYDADPRALDIALDLIVRGDDARLLPLERVFVYLPLEHAEHPVLQRQCVRLFARLLEDAPSGQRPLFTNYLEYAHKHEAVVAQFGRFPHRNALLGRANTPQEAEYLAQPGAGF
jgi:uncharacterized protein (DUF924 family)